MEYPVHLHCRKNQQWNMLKCNRAGDHYTLNKPSLLNKPAVEHAGNGNGNDFILRG